MAEEKEDRTKMSQLCRILAMVMIIVAIFMIYFFVVENPFKVGGRGRRSNSMKGGCGCAVPIP